MTIACMPLARPLVRRLLALLLGAGLSMPGPVLALEPVMRIAIYVQPYYESARQPAGTPRVAVASALDAWLASARREDLLRARDEVERQPEWITPMTLMVLAIRSYDLGLRDDAVFWFYVAKDRYTTLAEVLDMRSPQLAQVADAVRNFAVLAGPVLNGYAFCDLEQQRTLRSRAAEWVLQHNYQALFLEQLPARAGARDANLRAAHEKIRQSVAREAQYLLDPTVQTEFLQTRQANHAAEQYCWK